jgi:hypothetical protein
LVSFEQAKVILPYRDIDSTDHSDSAKLKRVIFGVLGIVVLLFLSWKALETLYDSTPIISYTDSSSRKSYGAVSTTHYLATQVYMICV